MWWVTVDGMCWWCFTCDGSLWMGCAGGVLHCDPGLWMGCVGGVLHVMGYCGWGVLVVFYM